MRPIPPLLRNAFFALALGLLSCLAAAQDTRLQLGTLSVDFPASWKFQRSGQRFEGHGPDGETVIATSRVLVPGAPPEAVEQHWKVIRSFARDEMPSIAGARGRPVLRPVGEKAVDGSRVLFSSVSGKAQEGPGTYLLQYLFGSSRVIAYFTVEGSGDATEAAARFEKILAARHWDE
jgi:hypothetical protein